MGSRFAALLALALVAAACGRETAILSGQDVVSTNPFAPPESARYRLLDGDEVKGSSVLTIEAEGDALIFEQSFEFPGQEITDNVSVVVDAVSLRPRRVERIIDGPEGERRCQTQYAGGVATVNQRSEKDERTDRLDVPSRSYDSWSDLFLWRTLAYEEAYEATYSDALTCSLAKPQILSVALKVRGKETVSVPAGTFQAWRLEIRSGGRTQRAWYADDVARTLVRYDNGDLVFELEPQD